MGYNNILIAHCRKMQKTLVVKERRAPGEHSKPGDAHLLLQARVKVLNQELK